ncbi:MAG: hypothetical protein Q8Q41_03025 [bacterium]|nr:hypothetical protein [bacterium]
MPYLPAGWRRIYLDLDNTLIDSVRRYEDEQETAERHGVPRAEYIRAVETLYARHGTASYCFPLLFSILIETRPDAPEALLAELKTLLDKQYFFPDTLAFLSRFSRKELVVVTEGRYEFQWPKAVAHNLLEYVRAVRISHTRKKSEMVEEHGQTFFLDDAARHIDEVKRAHPDVVCIQVRSAAPWEKKQTPALADLSCATLTEAADFIESLR